MLLLFLILILSPCVCVLGDSGIIATDEVYWINHYQLKPETIRYYESHGFYASSMTEGTIFKLEEDSDANTDPNAYYFNTIEFYSDPYLSDTNINGSFGFHIDFEHNLLYICVTNMVALSMAFAGESAVNFTDFQSGVNIVNLTDNRTLFSVDFADYDDDYGDHEEILDADPFSFVPFHFANDIVVDSKQNAYITDSFAGVVYQISPQSKNFSVSVLCWSADWITDVFQARGFLDGIALHPSEQYLMVSTMYQSLQYRVMLNNNDDNNVQLMEYTNIESSDDAMISAGFDGQVFDRSGEYLYVCHNALNMVFRFQVNANGNGNENVSLTLDRIIHSAYNQPTSISFVTDGKVFVGSAYFDRTDVQLYPIQSLDFSFLATSTTTSTETPNNNKCKNDSKSAYSSNSIGFMISIIANFILFIATTLLIFIIYRLRQKEVVAHSYDVNLNYQNLVM